MNNDPSSQALFLGDCVRRILRVHEQYDNKTDRDDTRNQRCLTSGFLLQELFNNSLYGYIIFLIYVMFAVSVGLEPYKRRFGK